MFMQLWWFVDETGGPDAGGGKSIAPILLATGII